MAKRRTRKQKENAKHVFTLSWENEHESTSDQKDVKGEILESKAATSSKHYGRKKAISTAQVIPLSIIKLDLIKSIIVASLILGLEIMIYFFWS